MALREAQRLERTARDVAFGKAKRAEIGAAVRDLALTALRSRILTLPHLADVACAIHHGIEPAPAGVKSGASTTKRALQGLVEAMVVALEALDLATREYVAVGGHLSGAEAEAWLGAIATLPEAGDPAIARLVDSIKTALQAAESGEPSEGTHILGLLASGALLGILRAPTLKG